MARIIAQDVIDIMDDDFSISTSVINTFITVAEEVVTNIYAGSTASVTLLKEIERYLTAHMIVSTLYRMGKEEKVGEAQIKYTGEWKEGLNSTPYGQMLLTIDTTGLILKSGKRSASIRTVESFDD